MATTTTEIKGKHTVHWFRKGLRLHDNPSLKEGLKSASTFRCVFIIDPWFAGSSNVGINKWRFLLQCLEDLDRSLRSLNSRLFVVRGQPADALPKLFKEWGTTSLTFEEDPEPYGRVRDHNITVMCKEIGIKVISKVSHTLYKLDTIIENNGGQAPLTYHQFQTIISTMGAPSCAEETITADTLGEAITPVSEDHDDKFGVPTLEELGFDTECLLPPVWVGGESEALARLERHLERKAWVASFGRPKMTPQSLLASQTGLSPYLRFGCLSTRLFYYQLTALYKKIKKARPPLSLHGQLLWREFFYCAATKNSNFDKMVGNPICVQIPWDKNNEALAKWANGQTGYPWIDAIMIQLREEGWIHHLARHAVACFLTRGDLWISWEEGMKVFEELLLDADWSVNAGTWMWLSCSSFFQQFFHCYCPVRFGRKADPNGDFIRKYIPMLKNIPTRYIHSPWLAPQHVQMAARCIIGQDYPMPMVDHSKASKSNIQRIKQVYHQLSKYRPLGNDDSSKNENISKLATDSINQQNIAVSSPSPNAIITSVNHSNYYCSTTPETQGSQQNPEEIENQNDEQYARYKKQDEDYENTKQTVSDLFTNKQSRNTSALQIRNMPYKKIVVVDEHYENMKREEISRTDSYQNINEPYNKTYTNTQQDGRNEYREIQRQSGFYVERITSSENNNPKVYSKLGETSQVKQYNYNNYNKSNNIDDNYNNPSTSRLFKQPSSDTLYGMKKKSYYLSTKTQQPKMSYKIDDNDQETQQQNRIYNLNAYQNYDQQQRPIDDQYNLTSSLQNNEYTTTSYLKNDIQNGYENTTSSYENWKNDINYSRNNVSSRDDAVQNGIRTHSFDCSGNEDYSNRHHDCDLEEEKRRFQQGKTVLMQGCSRPPNEGSQ